MPLTVLHLVGSPESDFFADLSRLYAGNCLRSLASDDRHNPRIAYVTPDATWRFPDSLDPADLAAAEPVSVDAAIARITAMRVDVMLPQLFDLAGMTSYRALFDVLGIPFVGNRADVMALGAHKARAKAVVAAAGVATPRSELLRRGDPVTLAPPVVVKPVDADNSVGVALARHAGELPALLAAAFEHSAEVLVESYVELGREVRCGVLERDGELVCLPLEEYAVDEATKPVRGYDDKIARADDGELHLMAKEASRAWIVDPADPVTQAVWSAARAAHRALGCRHYSLFDFRVDPAGRPWFLEAGLYCSFATTSVVAVMARAAGIELPELFATAVGAALRMQD